MRPALLGHFRPNRSLRYGGRLCGLMLCGLLAACSSTREVSLDEVARVTPDTFDASADTTAKSPTYLWWQVFSDESLNAYVEQTLRQNLELRQGVEQLAQAYAREAETRSGLFPQITAAFGIERRRTNVSAFSRTFTNIPDDAGQTATSSVSTTTYRASVPLRWELDLWGKIYAATQAAELDVLAAEERMRALALSISSQTVDTYYQAVELCSRLSLLRETIESDEQFYELIKKRYRSGVADALDVYQASQNLAVRKSEEPQFELELKRTLSALALLLGEYPRPKDICATAKLPTSVATLPVGVPADLLQTRPDVKQSFYELYAADKRLAFAIRDRLPAVVITASGGYEDLDFDQLFRPETLVWRLLAEVSQTVFDGGRQAAQVDLQEAVVSEKGAAYLASVLSAFRDVEDALSGSDLIAKRVALLEGRVSSAKRTQRYSMEQYVQGLSNYLPVLDAQRTLYLAERELLLARRTLISNHVDVARAVGVSWQEEVLRDRFLTREDLEKENA